ncbi:hypothetical protein ACHAW6_007904 [Cyclotella cf. meneghiniana]
MFVNTALRSVARVSSKRPMSTVAPKMHKAKDVWGELKATRPPPGHDHINLNFEIECAGRGGGGGGGDNCRRLAVDCSYRERQLRVAQNHATVFEPPYSPVVVGAAVTTVLVTGYGLMYFGMRHQQYKQGYWK